RLPLDRVDMGKDRGDAVALLLGDRRIEMDHGPLHRPIGEGVAEGHRRPELGAVELGLAEAALVDAEDVVRATEVLFAVAFVSGMSRGLGREIALAEHRARTRLDDGRLHVPW